LFGSVIGAGDAPLDKPSCEPVRLALAPSGVPAGDEVWFVGDTAVDMECAGNSGCVGVFLGSQEPAEQFAREFARFAPRLCFADGAGLFRSLEGLQIAALRPSW
jgi:phosphoglycolate phosphatase